MTKNECLQKLIEIVLPSLKREGKVIFYLDVKDGEGRLRIERDGQQCFKTGWYEDFDTFFNHTQALVRDVQI